MQPVRFIIPGDLIAYGSSEKLYIVALVLGSREAQWHNGVELLLQWTYAAKNANGTNWIFFDQIQIKLLSRLKQTQNCA